SKASTTLDLNASLYAAYDDDLTTDPGSGATGATPDGGAVSGTYTGLNGGLAFNHNGEHVGFGITGNSAYRYDTSSKTFDTVSDQGGISLSLRGKRNSLALTGSTGYRPLFTFAPFVTSLPDDTSAALPPDVDTAVIRQSAVSFGGGVAFSRQIGQHTSLSVNGSGDQTRYSSADLRQSQESLGGMFSHNLTAGLALRLGYTEHVLRSVDNAGNRVVTHLHDMNVGFDFNKRLGLTRKTTMGFSTGTSAVDQGQGTTFQGTGSAWLRRDLGQTWGAQATFTRGIGLRAGFTQPDLSNAVSVTLGGLVARRLDFRSSAAYTKGAIGLTSQNGYGSYNTSARLRFALSSLLAMYVEHVAYWYQFDNPSDLPGALSDRVLRQGVHAGITLWSPLYR
ncbi:MAG TPA: hypothetical protein VHZ73_14045, partial [Vicinamibacterales bacterium]|nr:hypothetical protein [Vicinamibacterales bacterium]